MKLLVLFSCFCLQLASAPAVRAYCLDNQASLNALDSVGAESQATVLAAALSPLSAEIFSPPAAFLSFPPKKSASIPGSKEFFIRTGLSPPLVIG